MLNGMARALALQLEQPQMSQLMFEERLGLLLDVEISSRDTRWIDRLLQAARLRQGGAYLEEIPFRRYEYWIANVSNVSEERQTSGEKRR
ncbi:ATP-binding protein [Brenneria uluponensis]|uniref:ATP-binding protein n=1 Tax=Brenneria uluponensis TaxID=3057057 RepID=UPI003CCC6AFD